MAMCEGTHFVDCEQPHTGEYKSFDGAGGNQAGFAYIINCLAVETHDSSWLRVTQAAFDSVRDAARQTLSACYDHSVYLTRLQVYAEELNNSKTYKMIIKHIQILADTYPHLQSYQSGAKLLVPHAYGPGSRLSQDPPPQSHTPYECLHVVAATSLQRHRSKPTAKCCSNSRAFLMAKLLPRRCSP